MSASQASSPASSSPASSSPATSSPASSSPADATPAAPSLDAPAAAATGPRAWWWKALLVVLAVAALLLLGQRLGGVVTRFALWVQGQGAWGPVVFVLGYAAAAVAFLPGSLLTLAGGAIFGLLRGVAYVWTGATLGAALAFLVSRYLVRGAIERRLAGNPRFAAIDRAVGRQGLKIVFLLRLSPLFPFNLLNYALGLTRVRFRDYLLASLAMIPGTVLYVYYGSLAGDVAALAAGGTQRATTPTDWVFRGVGLLATLIVTTVITRTAKRALAEEVDHAGS